MKKRTIFIFLILISISHFMCINDSAQTVAEWSQDIDILTAKIEKYHPAPWARISKEAFMDRAEDIKANLQEWNKERIILEVRKLVASLRDGHTGVLLHNQDNFNQWFPIRIEKFHDGLFITGADIENAGLLGAKVLRMGKLDAGSAYSRVGTIIATDSDHGIARLATSYLSNAVILKTLGIIDSQRLLPLEVLLQNGLKEKVSLESARWRMLFNLHYHKTRVPTNNETKTIFDDKLDSLPLYLSRVIPSRVPYWFEYIPDEKMIYLQYNNVTNWNKEPFGDFTKRLFKAYDKHISEVRSDYHNLILLDTFNDQGIAALASLYKDLKKSNPNEIHEHTLNTLGYRVLRKNRIQEALEIFKLNVEIHPEYANGYDSLGEAYMKSGENELAIENYQKSLELDPNNDNAKEMLEVLRKK